MKDNHSESVWCSNRAPVFLCCLAAHLNDEFFLHCFNVCDWCVGWILFFFLVRGWMPCSRTLNDTMNDFLPLQAIFFTVKLVSWRSKQQLEKWSHFLSTVASPGLHFTFICHISNFHLTRCVLGNSEIIHNSGDDLWPPYDQRAATKTLLHQQFCSFLLKKYIFTLIYKCIIIIISCSSSTDDNIAKIHFDQRVAPQLLFVKHFTWRPWHLLISLWLCVSITVCEILSLVTFGLYGK